MASTDTRSGFRLPWSSDRSHEEAAAQSEASNGDAQDTSTPADVVATDQPAALPESPAPAPEEPEPMVEMDTASAPAPAAPRKPSKLMADLSAAIRATAEAAREQALAQVDADARSIVDTIREGSTDGEAGLRQQSEADIEGIREWSKAEIARIKDETETRITARKASLDEELAAHAAGVEHRVEEVQAEVARFEAAMAAYMERLGSESDPARLATMAEEMPEPPQFDAWANPGTVETGADDPQAGTADAEAAGTAEAAATVAETWDAPDAEAGVGVAEADEAAPADAAPEATGDLATGEATAEVDGATVSAGDVAGEAEAPADAPDETTATEGGEGGAPEPASPSPFGDPWANENSWKASADATGDAGDVPRWADGDAPEGFPASAGGDPVDRGAIMAALEAAAEAVVAAESAAESADQAEAAADVAETAAGLLVGRTGTDGEIDPEAEAAMAARMDAGGYESESFASRLASLLPGVGETDGGEEPRTTQVVVTGLISVASIASFKRHLGRLAGVQGVTVASGPEGEFVFNLTHRADLSFRDAIPTLPGFAARVTSLGDGTVHVTARDPETEG